VFWSPRILVGLVVAGVEVVEVSTVTSLLHGSINNLTDLTGQPSYNNLFDEGSLADRKRAWFVLTAIKPASPCDLRD
jgi:hypothetical protein